MARSELNKLTKLMTILAENKKARFDCDILERFEAGIALIGQEVKSLKTRGISLAGSYVVVKENEVFWVGSKIPPYQPKNAPTDYNPERARKLLLEGREIKYLIGKTRQKGLTLVPLKVYTVKGKIKMEFGVGKGQKQANKKELIKKREAQKEIERKLKEY
ncbi:MAG: SsrA-binding protein [Candidatus Wildermuthbacteria bacterium RIFCSPLOWO2_12_FULL_40_9]|uniref:SsrA-binding protein n=2 Tax=Candidatus Wildermuthiibacteriota TaxID=1817923 RepID=A0A1G2REC5_9BACT|nr:MAG: SsrA-binding protein [Candidatus Wildermuthbacteria bacterium RIFCSPHIGHO2_12_FULL_40_12]OHA76930.1 MAG: SsrA-binding protein [Candidatus Wildermuthbacteria bacterium RIFCSPLOWO2_12_FULL_40_9]